MSNQKLARQWAERAKNAAARSDYTADTEAAIEHILATTTPLTMADTVWDDEEHHLAGATTPSGIEVVMLWLNTGINRIVTDDALYARDMLTPNGKRYELREVGAPEQPEHPATLVTQADYENAPVGTVVAEPCWPAWQKRASGKWVYAESKRDSGSLSGTKRRVLRWGWGK